MDKAHTFEFLFATILIILRDLPLYKISLCIVFSVEKVKERYLHQAPFRKKNLDLIELILLFILQKTLMQEHEVLYY